MKPYSEEQLEALELKFRYWHNGKEMLAMVKMLRQMMKMYEALRLISLSHPSYIPGKENPDCECRKIAARVLMEAGIEI